MCGIAVQSVFIGATATIDPIKADRFNHKAVYYEKTDSTLISNENGGCFGMF